MMGDILASPVIYSVRVRVHRVRACMCELVRVAVCMYVAACVYMCVTFTLSLGFVIVCDTFLCRTYYLHCIPFYAFVVCLLRT